MGTFFRSCVGHINSQQVVAPVLEKVACLSGRDEWLRLRELSKLGTPRRLKSPDVLIERTVKNDVAERHFTSIRHLSDCAPVFSTERCVGIGARQYDRNACWHPARLREGNSPNRPDCLEEFWAAKLAETERDVENCVIVEKAASDSLLQLLGHCQLADAGPTVDVDNHASKIRGAIETVDVSSWPRWSPNLILWVRRRSNNRLPSPRFALARTRCRDGRSRRYR
jgi:hypothetical protein